MSPSPKKPRLSPDPSTIPFNGQGQPSLPASPQPSPTPSSDSELTKLPTPSQDHTTSSSLSERKARFAALKSRAALSSQHNLKAAAAESARLATDPNALTALQRKQAIASHKLLKAETEVEGEDFERKRAWDWTIEESEKWDKRMDKKARHRNDVAFADYTQDAKKVYKRQLREMAPNLEEYEKQRAETVMRAARSGGLEIGVSEDGKEVLILDKNNIFFADAHNTEFVDNKPQKEAVDRLVKNLDKAEETRLKKRRARGREEEGEGDVTYINEKNKQFNQKLARFYNPYTAPIRESFERGTAI